MFKKFKGLIWGISSRRFGDGRLKKNQKKFLASLGLKPENLVLMEQVHGNKIKVVGDADRGRVISGVDGLITNMPGVILGARTADCLPVSFYDPEAKIIGVCHAGWRGVLGYLPQKMVDQIIRGGGLPENLLVVVGPHIGGCCYAVEKERAQKFLGEFGELEGMVYTDKKGVHLALSVPVLTQLLLSGLKRKNIFVPLVCTSCQNQEFFSFRKAHQTYGEMLTLVTLK